MMVTVTTVFLLVAFFILAVLLITGTKDIVDSWTSFDFAQRVVAQLMLVTTFLAAVAVAIAFLERTHAALV